MQKPSLKSHSRVSGLFSKHALIGLLLLVAAPAFAQYHYYNVPSGSDCIVQTYRSPNLPAGIYDAIHEEYITSSDGGSAYFYGGMVHDQAGSQTLVQYSMWPATGVFAPYYLQFPTFAGTNMTWWAGTGEGSCCSIKGYWPLFTTNLWSRFAVRWWQPADGTPHAAYQGMWMKEPVSGNWYHLGTLFYPFAATGVTGMSGWQENFSGSTNFYIVDHGGGYYHKNGVWQEANQIQYSSYSGYVSLIETNSATRSQANGVNTNLPCNVCGSGVTLTESGQAASPAFDPIVVTNAVASVSGTQLLVQWQVPLSSSPQLGYVIDVFNNAGYTGTPALSYTNNDPEGRQKLLNIPGVSTPYVRLTISDIFYNLATPILITPATATPSPASSVSGTVGGLAFQYYESASGDWTAIPNFSSLTPVCQGVVAFTDATPRRQRTDYGFNYAGYITAPSNGLYAFTLHSGDGSKLVIDGTTVINFDGLHDSSQSKAGGIALAAGLHTFNVQFFKGAANPVNTTAYTDGIGLSYEGPGVGPMDVPASAYSRVPGSGEPSITLNSPASGASVLNSSPGFTTAISANGATVNSVQYYLTDYYHYYISPGSNVDYYLGQNSTAPYSLNSMVWTAPSNAVRARLIYNGNRIIDSAPLSFASTNSTLAPWIWTPLDLHNIPSGASTQANTLNMVGDGMNLLTRQVTGDCTLIGRLSAITPNVAAPDGLAPDGSWRAGIILRGTTNDTTSQPLGDGGTTRFTALFSSVGGGTYYEDDTMRGGNGDANNWSANLGGNNRWFKLQRTGNTFLSFISMDGSSWNQVNSNTLANFGSTIYAGVFIYALQEPNPNIHTASFDSISLTGAGVIGPATVAVSPLTNAVVGGLSATFSASVIGPVPSAYQWQLNGTNISGATNSTYTIASAGAGNTGNYTVIANSVTSAPSALIITAPAGSGVWTNLSGGSWPAGNNWSGGLVAGGTDAVADFSTLSLNANAAVTLDGAKTVGTMLFDDLNPSVKHNWTLSTGSGGPLTLAVSAGTPGISVQHGTNIISAVIAGTQGFSKSGAGGLTLSGAGTFTGSANVTGGTLEVQNKSGDIPYVVSQGATLKIGYSTGGGYANTGMTVYGSGASSSNGFWLAGGQSYNTSGGLVLQSAPTTIRQYGSGLAGLGIFDINSTGLWCEAAASGSVIDPNIQIISLGYGMSAQVDAGASNATGDLTINGPLNAGTLGFYKRGTGSVLLKGAATGGNAAVQVQGGTVICGAANCLGANASVPVSSGATLALNGFNQTVSSLSAASGSTVSFGGAATLTVSGATLAGTLQMTINKGGASAASKLVVTGGSMAFGGTLAATSIGTNAFAAGDTFTLFSASGYSGAFTGYNLPALPVGLVWTTTNLTVNGTLVITTNGLSVWNGGGADGNWGTAANWSGTAPVNGQLLTFQGTSRQSNTNNLLVAAGQIVFNNGGFALSGNPLTLQWGVANLAGANTYGIGTTLGAAQSFSNAGGTLTLTGAVTNAGYALTLDGAGGTVFSGAITGAGALVKNGSGTATFSTQKTYTGLTTVNAGILDLTGGGGGSGVIRGTAAVNTGGTLRFSTGDAVGYNGGASALTTINLNGGTLNVNSTANQTLGGAVINMTGGTLTGVAGGNLDFFLGGSALNTLASSNTAVITVIPLSPLRQGSTTFTVAAGSTASGIDLDIFSTLRTSPSGDAAGAVFTKAGNGTMRLNAGNAYAKPTVVSAGTLLVGGSLAAGSTVTVSAGATLGGTGTVYGPATVASGATLAPGNNGIGTLTFGSSLALSGNSLMEIGGGAATSNDLVSVTGLLTLGGTLTLTNIGSSALAASNSFKLFNAGSWSGAFTNLTLPPLAPGLAWNTNTLASNGTLTVASLGPFAQPVISGKPVFGGGGIQFSFSGTNGQTYRILTTTNALLPMTSWTVLTNGVFGAGPATFSNAVAPGSPSGFYRVLSP